LRRDQLATLLLPTSTITTTTTKLHLPNIRTINLIQVGAVAISLALEVQEAWETEQR
jgi:hypothetical protein